MPSIRAQTLEAQGLLSVSAAAKLAQVHRSTIYRWIEAGTLKAKVFGGHYEPGTYYIKRSDLLARLGSDLCKLLNLK